MRRARNETREPQSRLPRNFNSVQPIIIKNTTVASISIVVACPTELITSKSAAMPLDYSLRYYYMMPAEAEDSTNVSPRTRRIHQSSSNHHDLER